MLLVSSHGTRSLTALVSSGMGGGGLRPPSLPATAAAFPAMYLDADALW